MATPVIRMVDVGEHCALRTTGFAALGPVTGGAVHRIGGSGAWDCGVRTRSTGIPGGRSHEFRTVEGRSWRTARQAGWRQALGRLASAAADRGADGVVAVACREQEIGPGIVAMSATGTAVRTDGVRRGGVPLLAALSGPDVARLLLAGYAPTGVLVAVAVVRRHDDGGGPAGIGWPNGELGGATTTSRDGQARARDELAREAAAQGATGVLLAARHRTLGRQACQRLVGGTDVIQTTTLVATGIVALDQPDGRRVGALPTLSLDRRSQSSGTQKEQR